MLNNRNITYDFELNLESSASGNSDIIVTSADVDGGNETVVNIEADVEKDEPVVDDEPNYDEVTGGIEGYWTLRPYNGYIIRNAKVTTIGLGGPQFTAVAQQTLQGSLDAIMNGGQPWADIRETDIGLTFAGLFCGLPITSSSSSLNNYSGTAAYPNSGSTILPHYSFTFDLLHNTCIYTFNLGTSTTPLGTFDSGAFTIESNITRSGDYMGIQEEL